MLTVSGFQQVQGAHQELLELLEVEGRKYGVPKLSCQILSHGYPSTCTKLFIFVLSSQGVDGRVTHVKVTLEVQASWLRITDVCTELSGSVDDILYGIFCHLSTIKYVEFDIKYQLQV